MSNATELRAEIAELTKVLKEAKKEEEAKRQRTKDKTPRKWLFTVTIDDQTVFHIFDPAVKVYRLSGSVTNAEECKAAGWEDNTLQSGGMNYLYNKLSERVILATSGIYISDSSWHGEPVSLTFAEIEAFLRKHPDGGDVTEIIIGQPNFKW